MHSFVYVVVFLTVTFGGLLFLTRGQPNYPLIVIVIFLLFALNGAMFFSLTWLEN